MKTGVRLVKDEEKVNDFSSYEMNTRKASLPPTSDIKVQTFFSCSFLNRRDKKGIVNVNKISESAWGCIFLCMFLKRSWIYYLRHKDPKISYCSNFSSWNHFTRLLITCEFEDIGYFLGKKPVVFLSSILLYVTNIKTSESSCKFIHLQHNRANVNTQVYREKWERGHLLSVRSIQLRVKHWLCHQANSGDENRKQFGLQELFTVTVMFTLLRKKKTKQTESVRAGLCTTLISLAENGNGRVFISNRPFYSCVLSCQVFDLE